MVLEVVLPLCAFWEEWSFGGFRYDRGDLVTRPGSLLVTILLVLSQFLALHRLHWCKLVDGLTATFAGLSLALAGLHAGSVPLLSFDSAAQFLRNRFIGLDTCR